MNKILIICSSPNSILNFRGDLINEFIKIDFEIHVSAPFIDSNADLLKELMSLGVIVHNSSMVLNRASISPIQDLKYIFHIKKILKSIKPKIVLSYTIKPVIYSGLAKPIRAKEKFYSLITGLGYAFEGAEQENKNALKKAIFNITRTLYKISLNRSDHIFFQNEDDLSLFKKNKIIKNELICSVVNGSGVNLSKFQHKPIINKSPIKFLFVGRLLKSKGIKDLIMACQLLRQQNYEFSLVVAGRIDANPESITESELKNYCLLDFFDYRGYQKDVKHLFLESNVFVLPSYREGTPRSTLEALATGRPIITTDAPGCRQTVIDGENGFLVPVRDPNHLAEVMKKFIINEDLQYSMGLKSRQIAESKFDVIKVNNKMMQKMKIMDIK